MTTSGYTPDPERVAKAVERNKTRAEQYIRDPEKSKELLDKAYKKTNTYEKSGGPLTEFWRDLKTLMRMLKSYTRHEYTHIAWGSLLLVVAAIIYFVSPIDLLPDWVPLAGFVDDAAITVFVISQLRADLAKFTRWENEQIAKPAGEEIIDL